MKTLILCVSLLISVLHCNAQLRQTLKKQVVGEDGKPLDSFNVLILNPADSSYIQGDAFFDGLLEMKHNFTDRKLIQIQCLGYEDLLFLEDFQTQTNVDTLLMKVSPFAIQDVVVTAKIPVARTVQGKTIVQIAGSPLQHSGEVSDILRRAPGLRLDDSGLTVFGRGAPLIYIDNRQASYREVQMLQPAQIISISIDRNPSAQYDAEYKSVLHIKTNRHRSETSGQVFNHSSFGRRYSDRAGGQLQISHKKWIHYLSYNYTNQTHHDFVRDAEAIHLQGHEMVDAVYTDQLHAFREHAVLYGSVIDISPRHKLSWQYNGEFRVGDSHYAMQETRYIGDNRPTNLHAYQNEDGRKSAHTMNLRYLFAADSVSALKIHADYAYVYPKSLEQITQNSGDLDTITIRNNALSHVAAFHIEYNRPLWGADLLLGLHYGYIHSQTDTKYDDECNQTRLNSNNLAAFLSINKEYTKWGWQVGLRGESMNDQVRVDRVILRNKWDSNLFPSFDIHTSDVFKNVDFSISYTSKIHRPSVGQLDPSTTYVNSVVVARGNPLLKSTVSHNLEFAATLWNNLSLTVDAEYTINPTIDAGTLADDKRTIVFQPLNIDKSRCYSVYLTYSNQWGPFSMTLHGGIEFPFTKIPYMDDYLHIGKASYYGSLNGDIQISKTTFVTCGFEYDSRSYDLMTVSEPAYNLTGGIAQYFFKRRLQLSVSGYDLLRQIHYDNWHDRYGYYETASKSNRDRRYLRVSIRYTFNKHKNKYQQSENSEEYNRIH